MRLVFVTVPEENASDIAKALVRERLAAGVTIIGSARSAFWWEGDLSERQEAVLIFRTAEQLTEQLAGRVRELHPYEIPEILTLPAHSENPDYLKWLNSQVLAPAAQRQVARQEKMVKTQRFATVTDALKAAAATPLKVIVVGAPGAGARTLGFRIARRLHWPYYSPLDQHLDEGGLKKDVKKDIEAGRLIPDKKLLKEADASLEEMNEGGVVAGFPRTNQQAEIIKKHWGTPDIVFLLNVKQDVAKERLAARLSCGCGRTYGQSVPPHKPGVCDACGGKLFHRADDNDEEAVKGRFAVWNNITRAAILSSFGPKLHPLDADRGYEPVLREASNVLLKALADKEAARSG